ncbi:threonine--tRNA ligase, partial [Psychromonas aquatilis]
LKLGTELDLYHIKEEGPGMVFWHPNGWTIFRELESYIREQTLAFGYQEVKAPQNLDRSLWEKSAHCDKYKD